MQLSPWTSTSNLTQTPRARKKLGKQSEDGSWQFTFHDNSTYGSQDSLGTNKKKKKIKGRTGLTPLEEVPVMQEM